MENDDKKVLNGNLAVQYGQGKNLDIDVSLTKNGDLEQGLVAEISTPAENHKNTKIIVQTKRDQESKHVTSNVQIISDGKKWVLESELLASELAPLIDIQLRCPQGKLSRFYVKGNKVSDKEFGGDLKIIHENKNFLLEGNADVNVESIDQFSVKANINSPSLNLNKISFEAYNKPGKIGRRIVAIAKSAGKNLLSGSTSYQAREEQGKYVVEGSGSFKVKEETQTAHFKYISQRLNEQQHGEQGIEITFDAGLGSRAIDAEFKISNKNRQFRVQGSYCEAKKECAHIEVDSKINVNGKRRFSLVSTSRNVLMTFYRSAIVQPRTRNQRRPAQTRLISRVRTQNGDDQKRLHPRPHRRRSFPKPGKQQVPVQLLYSSQGSRSVLYYPQKDYSFGEPRQPTQ